jgi:hypothetical protein
MTERPSSHLSVNHLFDFILTDFGIPIEFLGSVVASVRCSSSDDQKTELSGQGIARWIFEFKRDWNSMINAIAFPEMKKSLLRWLIEPRF